MNGFFKFLLISFIALLIIILSAFTTFYILLNNKLNKIDYVDLKKTDVYIDEKVDKDLSDYRNIALLGIDARADTFSAGNRSDCIMIISINKTTGDVKIASVYRDTYLNINGYGLDKVTHAYSFGGPALAISTLNKNLDLNISEFVTVNFETVRTVVDSIGGVNITIDSDEVKFINGISSPGTYNLNGDQALTYSRIRHTDGGDYKRTERMREVLLAVFNKSKTLGIGELNNLADIILPHISTNISKSEIMSLLPKIASYSVKENFGWPYKVEGYTGAAWYGVPVDLQTNVKQLHEDLFDENNYEPSSTVKEISKSIVDKTGYTR